MQLVGNHKKISKTKPMQLVGSHKKISKTQPMQLVGSHKKISKTKPMQLVRTHKKALEFPISIRLASFALVCPVQTGFQCPVDINDTVRNRLLPRTENKLRLVKCVWCLCLFRKEERSTHFPLVITLAPGAADVLCQDHENFTERG